MKNENKLLPIKQGPKKIAVIGQNASMPVATGGGSAALRSSYIVSPLDAITQASKEIGAQVEYSLGAGVNLNLPLATPYLSSKGSEGNTGTLEFWLPGNNPGEDWLNDTAGVTAQSAASHTSQQDGGLIMLLDGEFAPMAVPDQYNRV